MEEETFIQYSIAGLKGEKWYREGRFRDIDSAIHYFKHHRKEFKQYSQLKLQTRTISKWEDEGELNWLEEE